MIYLDWNNINTNGDTTTLGPIEYNQTKVPSLVRKHADYVRGKTYGQDVRESLARGIEYTSLVATEAVEISNDAKERQDTVESHFNSLEQEMTNKDVISAPEIIAARDGRETLNERLSEDFAKANSKFRHDEYSNGMYSWWVYPLSVYENYSTFFGTISDTGIVHLNVFDHVTRKFDRTEVYQSEIDDHNAPSVNILKDGRIAVIYARHGQEKQVRFRITEKPYDIHALGAEKTIATNTVISYVQSYVDDNNRIHIFTRREASGWFYLRTDDEGQSWAINRRLTWIGEGRTELFYMKIKPTRLDDGTEVIRMIFTIHPEQAVDEQDIYYAALNVKTGNVFIPSTSIGNAYEPGFGSIVELSSLQKVYTPASGKRTRIYDVSTGELSVVFLEFTTKADAVYKLSKWNGSGFDTYTLTEPGVPIGSSVSYFGGAMFSDYADNEVLLAKENQGTWTIERWNLNNANEWETDVISQSNGEKIFRPITPLGNSGNIMYVKGEYAEGSYTDYDTNVIVLHTPESDGKFSTKDTQEVEVVTPTPTTNNVFKSSNTYERINITDTDTKSGSISVVFDEPFHNKPVVVAQSLHIAFNVSLSNITTSGFDITVRNVLNELDYPIVDVNWIAIGK